MSYELYNHMTIRPFKGNELLLRPFKGNELMRDEYLWWEPLGGPNEFNHKINEIKLFWE